MSYEIPELRYVDHIEHASTLDSESLKQICKTARQDIQLMRSFEKEHRELWTEKDAYERAKLRSMLDAYEEVLASRGDL